MLLRYCVAHASFCFLIFALTNNAKQIRQADISSDYFAISNMFAPLGTLIVCLIKLSEPQTKLYLKQVAVRYGLKKKAKMSKLERKYY